jgi:hypothetical protein
MKPEIPSETERNQSNFSASGMALHPFLRLVSGAFCGEISRRMTHSGCSVLNVFTVRPHLSRYV